MTYEEFIAGTEKYWGLFEKGLKKQANKFLFGFAEQFGDVPQDEGDAILCRFCREYIDGDRFDGHKRFGLSLPFQLTGLLNDYLTRECKAEKMPQMRWAYQIFGKYYNPHDPTQSELDAYNILARAYAHPDCDQKTVDLYLEQQVDWLAFGAHHFPDGCCIAREGYEAAVKTAETIISEKRVPDELIEAARYYKALYELYYRWHDGGRSGDFAELCKAEGLEFHELRAFYYN